MTVIDPLLRDFVKREDLPFVVAMAGNSKGITYPARLEILRRGALQMRALFFASFR